MGSKTDRVVWARCKAFTVEGVKRNRCLVERDGAVLVWDAVAGHYTRCHVLNEPAQRRIRRLAGWKREG